MGVQLLFVIESTKKAKTDWAYINGTIKHYYRLSPEYSIKPIPMGGKSHFKDASVSKQIKDYREQYLPTGRTIVVYCIDTDNYHTDPERYKELEDIKKYCSRKGFELIWFCRNIEEVYWGERVESGDKVKRAAQFNKRNHIHSLSEKALSTTVIGKGKSNILVIMDKYLNRR